MKAIFIDHSTNPSLHSFQFESCTFLLLRHFCHFSFFHAVTAPPISKGLIPGISQSILTAARRGEALMIRELLKTATAADVNYRDEVKLSLTSHFIFALVTHQ